MQITKAKVFSAIFKEIHKIDKIEKYRYQVTVDCLPISDIIKMHLWSIMYELKLQDNPEHEKRLKKFIKNLG